MQADKLLNNRLNTMMQAVHIKLKDKVYCMSHSFTKCTVEISSPLRYNALHSTGHLIYERNLLYTFSEAYSYWGPLSYGRLRIGRVSLYHRDRNRRGHFALIIVVRPLLSLPFIYRHTINVS